MGAACASGISTFTSNTSSLPTKILILGPQNSGKTHLLYSWKYGADYILSIEPTSHFNVETVTSSSGQKYLAYDLAGNIGYRVRPFLEGANGIIYMLGCDGESLLSESEAESIVKLLKERDMENVPVLFVIKNGSKSDDCSQDLSNKLSHILEGRVWDAVQIKPNSQEDADQVLNALEKLINKPFSKVS
ncbi:ADP-ribosylation factor-like isoform X1 [Biomphalaria pfeifferi]|uniref:ADP-ribosylation factor-like isoform X1 n=1 Tax=Biomphalaria pfeifferi TaxID=112525 RepID=A0AAD8BCM7_BIOPF|nr:ADP-ribosylation factor-like isoform X1 [Biomphalaria pfeifferi]